MKKSILALGAAAVVGGLGFAGSAHALAYIGPPATAPVAGMADSMWMNPGSTGHMLFVPYYSAQGGIATLLNITNTDTKNGKAVKVRFRGAANSDDILDFTVYLSPGDVWTATLNRGSNGFGQVTSTDKSCTQPTGPYTNVQMRPDRLNPYLAADAQALHTNEGYVEILSMADIPQNYTSHWTAGAKDALTGTANPLFTAIKHVNGVPPCTGSVLGALLDTKFGTAMDAENAGLYASSGQLMASWGIFDQQTQAAYSGVAAAIQAYIDPGQPMNFYGSAYANIAFSPQIAAPMEIGDDIKLYTADPLLRMTAYPLLTPLWFDLPDMSTPLIGPVADKFEPTIQAGLLSDDLAKPAVINEYVFSNGAVPMQTDWVVSQPTRRYHAAVNYLSATSAEILWNLDTRNDVANTDILDPVSSLASSPYKGKPLHNRYDLLQLVTPKADMGPYACLTGGLASTDREEASVAPGADFSPGTISTKAYCGEVFTLSFGSPTSQVLQAQVANVAAPGTLGEAGWAMLTLLNGSKGVDLPIVGFAATSLINQTTGANFAMTLPHRW